MIVLNNNDNDDTNDNNDNNDDDHIITVISEEFDLPDCVWSCGNSEAPISR